MTNINYLPPKDEGFYDQLFRLYPEEDRMVGTITFQVTENCCLACTYCYQHNKSNNIITFEIAKKVIDNLLTNQYSLLNTHNTNALILDFIGGEPLLEIELIQQIVDYYFETAILMKHEWAEKTRISLCSNGVLYFNEKVQQFFKKYKYLISFCVSIDGNKELHDSCRVDLQGNGSYDKAIAAVNHYRENYGQYINTKMTLTSNNLKYFYNSIIDLIKNKYTIIHANCVFEDVWQKNDPKIFYEQLIQTADFLIDNNLYNKINITIFQEDLGQPMNLDDNKNWCGGYISDQSSFAVDYQGNFYSCIRYMDSSLNGKQLPLYIGQVNHGLFQTEIEQKNTELLSNITRRSQSTDECFYCPVAKGCGWCSGFNYEETGTPNKRVTYICNMHKVRVLANLYYWNKIYLKNNIDKQKKNYLEKNECIFLIGEENYNKLLKVFNN